MISRPRAATGVGVDWPFSYEDLAPYYSKVERFVGISGRKEGIPSFPRWRVPASDGFHLWRARAQRSRRGEVRAPPVTIGRTAVLTADHNGREACHYCGPCNRGCVTYSYFSSPFTSLRAAELTGRLTVFTDAVVSRVTTDRGSGLASGVAYVERATRTPREIHGKVIVLCASTLESTRILLNSAPGGLANVQRSPRSVLDGITCTARVISGRMPQIKPARPWHGPPRRPNGIFIPRFRNVTHDHANGVIRGFSYQGGVSPRFATNASGFGRRFKQAVHGGAFWQASLHGFSECLPSYDNFAELDPYVVDAWGIPVLRIHMQWSDNERALFRDSLEQGAAMLEAAGAVDIRMADKPKTPGDGIHEVGTARMGYDRKRSVLNQYCQSHDIKNLFVMDGAAFPSLGSVNPTLTMMANAARACDYLVEAVRRGDLG